MATELFSFQQKFRMASMFVFVMVENYESQRRLLAAQNLHDATQLLQKLLHQTNKTT